MAMGSGSGTNSRQIMMTNSMPSNASVPCTPTTVTAFQAVGPAGPRVTTSKERQQAILQAVKQQREEYDAISLHLFEGLPENTSKRDRTRSFLHLKDLALQSMYSHDCVYMESREARRRQVLRAAVPPIRVGSSLVKQNSWSLIEKHGRLPKNDQEMDKWLKAEQVQDRRKRTALGGFKKEGYGKDDLRGLKRTASSVVEVREEVVVKRSKSVPTAVAGSSTTVAGHSTHFLTINEEGPSGGPTEAPAPTSSQRAQLVRPRPSSNSQSIRHTFAATKPSSQDFPPAKASKPDVNPPKPVNGWNNARRKSGLEEKRRRASEEKRKKEQEQEQKEQASCRPVWAAKVPGDDSDTEDEEDGGLSSMATARSYMTRPKNLESAFRKTMAQRTVNKAHVEANAEVDELGSSLPAVPAPFKAANEEEIDELGSSLNIPSLPPPVAVGEISFTNVRTSTPIDRRYSSPARKSFSQMSEPNHDESGTDEEERPDTNPEVYGMIMDLIEPGSMTVRPMSPLVHRPHRFAQAVQPSQSTQSGTPPSSQRMSTQKISKMTREKATDMVALLNGDIEDQVVY